jgi:hypothetical protein
MTTQRRGVPMIDRELLTRSRNARRKLEKARSETTGLIRAIAAWSAVLERRPVQPGIRYPACAIQHEAGRLSRSCGPCPSFRVRVLTVSTLRYGG